MWIDSWAGSPRPRSRRAAVSLTRLTITRTNVWSHLLNSLHLTTKRLSSSTTNKHARVISPVHWEYYLLLQAYNQNIPSKFSVISWFITCDICSPITWICCHIVIYLLIYTVSDHAGTGLKSDWNFAKERKVEGVVLWLVWRLAVFVCRDKSPVGCARWTFP